MIKIEIEENLSHDELIEKFFETEDEKTKETQKILDDLGLDIDIFDINI